MARNTPVPLRVVQGSPSEIAAATGASGEVNFDTGAKTLVAHDGVTRGGFHMMRQDMGVRKDGDTMSGPLKMPTPQKGLDDNTGATCDWVNDILWGRRLAGTMPEDLTLTLQDMPLGAFLNMPDVVVPGDTGDPEIQALEARIATLELQLSTLPDMAALVAQVSGLTEALNAAKARIAALEAQAVSLAVDEIPANPSTLINSLPLGGFVSTPE